MTRGAIDVVQNTWKRAGTLSTACALWMLLTAVAATQESPEQERTISAELPTVAGTLDVSKLRIDRLHLRPQIRLEGRLLLEEPKFETVEVSGAFPEPGPARVILFALGTGGSGCPGFYKVLEIRPDGSFVRTREFGNCSPLAKAQFRDGVLTIEIPKIGGAAAQSWRYRDGNLRRMR